MQTLRFDVFEKNGRIAVIPAAGSASIFTHDHNFTELVYVSRGSALHIIDSISQRIGQGDLFIVPVGHAHSIKPAPDSADFEETFGVVNVIFEPARFAFDANRFLGRVTNVGDDDRVLHLIRALLSEYERREPHAQEILQGYLTALLGLIKRGEEKDRVAPADEYDRNNAYVTEAVDYINLHYARRFSIDDVARHAGVSKGYLQRLFKANTGQTITHAVASHRVQHACELLISSDLTVYEIASRVGFADVNQLHIAFKDFVGVTPRAYRMNNGAREGRDREGR